MAAGPSDSAPGPAPPPAGKRDPSNALKNSVDVTGAKTIYMHIYIYKRANSSSVRVFLSPSHVKNAK